MDGQLLALLLNVFAITNLRSHREREGISTTITVRGNAWNFAAIGASGFLFARYGLYGIGENLINTPR